MLPSLGALAGHVAQFQLALRMPASHVQSVVPYVQARSRAVQLAPSLGALAGQVLQSHAEPRP